MNLKKPAQITGAVALWAFLSFSAHSFPGHEQAAFSAGPMETVGGTEGAFDNNAFLTPDSPDTGEISIAPEETRGPIVPEPVTMLLLGCGLIGLAGLTKRLKR
jgi:hypothetical protein